MAWSLDNYEPFIYSAQELSSHIQTSNVIFIRRGKFRAEVKGNISFMSDIILEVREILYFTSADFIQKYSYVVKKESNILYWYDPQAHPDHPDLQSTHPHHKHIPPDIKHHRIPRRGFHSTSPISLS